MNVVVIGNDAAFAECKARLGAAHQYEHARSTRTAALNSADVVFDLADTHDLESIRTYSELNVPVFLNTVFTTLSTLLVGIETEARIFGCCALPTFFDREVLEVSLASEKHRPTLEAILQALGQKYIVVMDQVGLVTPRVVCMIINEAFETLRNGVASRTDIDLSMKLGTNYPFGPFEWSERIGVSAIRDLLAAIQASTGDVRYRPTF